MRFPSMSDVFSRAALAFCFLGFGIWELVSPRLWTTYVPTSIGSLIDPVILVWIHGAILSIVGLGVLSGYFRKIFWFVAVLLMLEVSVEIFVQEGFTDIFIRDVAILLFACSAFFQEKRSL